MRALTNQIADICSPNDKHTIFYSCTFVSTLLNTLTAKDELTRFTGCSQLLGKKIPIRKKKVEDELTRFPSSVVIAKDELTRLRHTCTKCFFY